MLGSKTTMLLQPHKDCCRPTKTSETYPIIVVNDLDRELSDDVLNQLAIEDALPEQFCQLSLNAISSLDHSNCIKLKTKVHDKVMLVLVDTGSSHNFVSSNFVQLAGLSTVTMPKERLT